MPIKYFTMFQVCENWTVPWCKQIQTHQERRRGSRLSSSNETMIKVKSHFTAFRKKTKTNTIKLRKMLKYIFSMWRCNSV